MKKKAARIKKRMWHKLTPFVLLASALVAGVIFIQTGSLNQTINKTPPKIDAISPTVGRADALVIIHGSGFTTQQEHDTRIKSVKDLPAGNYLRIAGAGTMGPPSFSSDGKTLKFQLALDETQVPKNCVPGATEPKCQISLQVVNGEGMPSNIVHFQLYMLSRPLVITMSLDSQNPTAQNIATGAKDVEVLRFKVKASADNPVNFDITEFIVKTVPTRWEIYCNSFLDKLKIFDASTGELLGSYLWYPDPAGAVYGVVYCSSAVPTWLSLSPGQEKTLSVKLSLVPQAKAGLLFRIAAYKAFNGVDAVIKGDDSYFDGLSYAGVTGNLITITP